MISLRLWTWTSWPSPTRKTGGQRGCRQPGCGGAQPAGGPGRWCGRSLHAARGRRDAFRAVRSGSHRSGPWCGGLLRRRGSSGLRDAVLGAQALLFAQAYGVVGVLLLAGTAMLTGAYGRRSMYLAALGVRAMPSARERRAVRRARVLLATLSFQYLRCVSVTGLHDGEHRPTAAFCYWAQCNPHQIGDLVECASVPCQTTN